MISRLSRDITDNSSVAYKYYINEEPRWLGWSGIDPSASLFWDLLYILSASAFFLSCHLLVRHYADLTIILKEKNHASYQNLLVSLIHAVLMAIGSTILFFSLDEMRTHIYSYYGSWAKLITLITAGYFVFDAYDYTRRKVWRQEIDIFWHHFIVMSGLCFTFYHDQYYGFVVTGLMVEWNSIILHMRRIYLWMGKRKEDVQFRVLGWLNLATLIVFRLLVVSYLGYALYIEWVTTSIVEKIVAGLLIIGLQVVNLILLYRIYASDRVYLF